MVHMPNRSADTQVLAVDPIHSLDAFGSTHSSVPTNHVGDGIVKDPFDGAAVGHRRTEEAERLDAATTSSSGKKVSFCTQVRQYTVRHRSDLSFVEVSRLWYTKSELTGIKRDVNRMLLRYRRSLQESRKKKRQRPGIQDELSQTDPDETENEFVVRGLEHRLSEQKSELRRQQILESQRVVLQYCKRLRSDARDVRDDDDDHAHDDKSDVAIDPVWIAEVYADSAMPCIRAAQIRAKADEDEARQIRDECVSIEHGSQSPTGAMRRESEHEADRSSDGALVNYGRLSRCAPSRCLVEDTHIRTLSLSSSPSQDARTLRRVSFHLYDSVYEHIHLGDFTDEELSQSWYHPDENAAMRADRKMCARMLCRRNLRECDEYTIRGLDGIFPHIAIPKQERRLQGWDAVLDEQDEQIRWHEQSCGGAFMKLDAHAIADAYRPVSEISARIAQDQGIEDAKAALSGLRTECLAREVLEDVPDTSS